MTRKYTQNELDRWVNNNLNSVFYYHCVETHQDKQFTPEFVDITMDDVARHRGHRYWAIFGVDEAGEREVFEEDEFYILGLDPECDFYKQLLELK